MSKANLFDQINKNLNTQLNLNDEIVLKSFSELVVESTLIFSNLFKSMCLLYDQIKSQGDNQAISVALDHVYEVCDEILSTRTEVDIQTGQLSVVFLPKANALGVNCSWNKVHVIFTSIYVDMYFMSKFTKHAETTDVVILYAGSQHCTNLKQLLNSKLGYTFIFDKDNVTNKDSEYRCIKFNTYTTEIKRTLIQSNHLVFDLAFNIQLKRKMTHKKSKINKATEA